LATFPFMRPSWLVISIRRKKVGADDTSDCWHVVCSTGIPHD
jgi:hypothetical protein